MKGNFLAQFTGEQPEQTLWGIEILAEGVRVVHIARNFQQALTLARKLRQLHPSACIRLTADAVSASQGGEK